MEDAKGPKILIVDDDPEIRRIISEFLSNIGFNPIQVSNALSVVRKIKNLNPSLMILDMKMPGADGIQIIRTLKRESIDIPIVVVSGALDEKTAGFLISQGVKSILAKPVNLKTLADRISKALETSKD